MKKVSPSKKAKFTGSNLLGELIEYEFELMTAAVGLPLFHEEMMGIAGFCQQVRKHIEADESDRDIAVIVMTCRSCFETKKIVEMKEKLLSGVRIKDPLDMYAALYHALMANYGATLDPFLTALDKQGSGDDTSQKSATETTDQP